MQPVGNGKLSKAPFGFSPLLCEETAGVREASLDVPEGNPGHLVDRHLFDAGGNSAAPLAVKTLS